MGLFSLVVYGVGDMIGSGIYGTVGDAAVQMGNAVWLAFAVSMVAAILTGLSYACLASRYPRAAGAAYVTQRAFHFAFLSYLIGLMVTASGLTSMATSTNVFTRTVLGLTVADPNAAMQSWHWYVVALSFIGLLTFVNFWGIRQSMWTNIVCTFVEVGGLIFIIAIGMRFWGSVNYLETPRATFDGNGLMLDHGLGLSMLLAGSVLTFFSFIGFEDMLNVSEEVKEPRRTMPRGIVLALLVATVLYIGVAVTAVSGGAASAVWPEGPFAARSSHQRRGAVAAAADVRLRHLVRREQHRFDQLHHGLAAAVRHGAAGTDAGHPGPHSPDSPHAPRRDSDVAGRRAGARSFGRRRRRQATCLCHGLLLLCSFIVVNTSLIVLKLRPGEPAGGFEVPIIIPALGILVNATMIVARISSTAAGNRALAIAGAIIGSIAVLYLIIRPKNVTEESLAAIEEES